MSDTTTPASCLNCGRTETEFPLVVLQLGGRQKYICPQCLPALIHHPDRLMDKLLAAVPVQGAPPCDH